MMVVFFFSSGGGGGAVNTWDRHTNLHRPLQCVWKRLLLLKRGSRCNEDMKLLSLSLSLSVCVSLETLSRYLTLIPWKLAGGRDLGAHLEIIVPSV